MIANENILTMLKEHELNFYDPEQATVEYKETKNILIGIINKQHKALQIAIEFIKALETLENYHKYGGLAKSRISKITEVLGG